MGIVSPTEQHVIAVVYGLFAGGIIYRELKWEDIKFAFAETVRTSGRIFIVIGAAKLYTVMLTTAGFDKWVAKTMLGFSTNPTVILIMILLIFFIVTMFMESIATLTLFMPILYPMLWAWASTHRAQRSDHRGHRHWSGHSPGGHVYLRCLRPDGYDCW